MRFGTTNKIHQDLNEKFGENAALLEERLKAINWRYFSKVYGIAFVVFTISVFIFVSMVRLAFFIF